MVVGEKRDHPAHHQRAPRETRVVSGSLFLGNGGFTPRGRGLGGTFSGGDGLASGVVLTSARTEAIW